jgi:hypothetical protein
MAMKNFLALVLVGTFCTVQLRADNPNLGTAGAQFLKIPAGARAAGMSAAYVSNANDASSLFWNPAGIVNVRSTGFTFSHTSWWASIQINQAAFVQSFEDVGSIGVSITSLGMDKMEVTTEDMPEGTGQTFDAQDLMVGLSFARKLTESFSVGVSAKYVQQRIWNESASGVAFDIGTQYRIGFRDLTLGMSMTNFGGDLSYGGRDLAVKYDIDPRNPTERLVPATLAPDDYPLPLHFQVGLSISPYLSDEFSVLVAADVAHPNDNRERVNVGTEIDLFHRLFLRAGYRFGYDVEKATLGAGVSLPLGDVNITVDYAYGMYDLLPNISWLSLGITF